MRNAVFYVMNYSWDPLCKRATQETKHCCSLMLSPIRSPAYVAVTKEKWAVFPTVALYKTSTLSLRWRIEEVTWCKRYYLKQILELKLMKFNADISPYISGGFIRLTPWLYSKVQQCASMKHSGSANADNGILHTWFDKSNPPTQQSILNQCFIM